MPIAKSFIEELEQRQHAALDGANEAKLQARKKKGLMTARERLLTLFDDNSFLETGKFAEHACHDFGMENKKLPGDGVVTGLGSIEGRSVAAFSQDFLTGGGALGQIHAKKICQLMVQAQECGMPFIAFNDSGGARIQEGVDSLSGYGQVFYQNVQLSGLVPQIAVIAGPCAGGAAYSPALMDFLIMTKEHANMFICGPEVIKAATGESASMNDIGSAAVQASVSGNVHFVAENDEHALQLVRRLLSYLPSNNLEDPPHELTDEISLAEDSAIDDVLPEDPHLAFDVYEIIDRLVDKDSFFEVMSEWAKNLIIGFARIDGLVIGLVANQPCVKAGAIDIDASDKGARFVRFCNAFNIPILTLVDVPGFLPGVHQEQNGIIRHGAKMLFAYAAATVPKITVIMRKAYGGAYLAMCSEDLGADYVFAWPCAEIAVMGAEGAVKILYRKKLSEADNPAEVEAELSQEYRDKFASPYAAAQRAMISDVIKPSQTRGMVSYAFRTMLNKRLTRPAKKHGLIPL